MFSTKGMRQRRNICKAKKIALSLMGFMNVYCVLAAQLHAHLFGGILTSFWGLLHCSGRVDLLQTHVMKRLRIEWHKWRACMHFIVAAVS